MKKNILNNTIMKTMKYICLLLMIIGTSAHALAASTVTETINFSGSDCSWGFSQGNSSVPYVSGTFKAYGFSIYAYNVKYNYYNGNYSGVQVQYHSSGAHDTNGYLILPNFGGKITSISVYTYSGASSSQNQYLNLYVNDVAQAEKTLLGGGNSTTPATWSGLNIAAGTEVKIMNTSTLNGHTASLLHIERIVVTHEGSAIGSATASDGKYTLSAVSSPMEGGKVTISPERPDGGASVSITATPNSGFSFSYWTASTTYSCTGDPSNTTNAISNTSSASTSITMPYGTTMLTAVFVESTCTKTPTITFATSGTIEKKVGADEFTNAATVKFGVATGQTITYSSSNENIAIVDDATGEVLVADNAVGSATITASVVESGDYCAQ